MTSVISGGAPQDLIAYAWFVMGFRPRESVVVVGLSGDGLTSGLVARLDLPAERHAARAAVMFAEMLERTGDDACLVLVTSDAAGDAPLLDGDGAMPHDGLAMRLGAALAAAGVHVVDALLVGTSTYRSYLCEDDGCCPPTGRPLTDVTGSRVAAAMVLEGRCVLDDEQDLVADVDPGAAAARGEPVLVLPKGRPGRGRRRAAFLRWCADLDADAQEPTRADDLLAALTADRDLRDAVLFSLVPGGRTTALQLLEGRRPGPLGPDRDIRPQGPLVRVGDRLLACLARRAPAGSRAEPLAALAWLAWWSGDAVRGRLLADRALQDVPGHRLAGLVHALLEGSVPPPWTDVAQPAARPRPRAAAAVSTGAPDGGPGPASG
ncbi:DUF4192 domain-containing protein [Kineosporia sp. R_H_3]|uniref:DUF4192 domain-containing protein n=1 Tax=Kineosporia sp. R_H_3 TaxID=1961848 RepID=UPI000B4AA824|nr:DUF4192 domain-containing protein [Kineosporia sp. R_H_3]